MARVFRVDLQPLICPDSTGVIRAMLYKGLPGCMMSLVGREAAAVAPSAELACAGSILWESGARDRH